jgi:hypothetical protein
LQRFKQDGAQYDRAGCEALPEDRDTRQIEELPVSAMMITTDDRAKNLALSPVKIGAADHGCRITSNSRPSPVFGETGLVSSYLANRTFC